MMVGLFEPRAARVAGRRHPARLLVRRRSRPTGTGWAPFLETRDGARAGHPRGRRPHVLLRAGVVHARPGAGRRRGARASAATSSPPGMNSVGILSAGGLGRVLAHWIIDRPPGRRRHRLRRRPLPRRTSSTPAYRARPHHRDPRHRVRRAHAGQAAAHRARRGCSRRCTTGWSSNGGLPARGVRLGGRRLVRRAGRRRPTAEPTWGRAPWFEQWAAEHRAVREGVGLMDMSFMAKFRGRAAPTPARCSTGSRPAP